MRFQDGGVGVQRMIGEEGIDPVEIALGGVDGLRAADLFGRLAEELERAADAVLLHGGFGGEDAAERADAKHGMGIGVAGGPGMQPFARGLIGNGLLGIAGNGVVFGVGADDRTGAVRPGGGEGGGHAAGALFDLPAIGAQQIDIGFDGFVFTPGGFGVAPDFEIEV